MRQPIVIGPEDGDRIDVVGDRYRLLAEVTGTDSSYGLFEATVPPGGGPPPHSHAREEEGFYVLEGEITIRVDGQTIVARPGAFVNLPKGSVHSFRNETDRTARMLVLVAPGGFEQMLRAIGTVAPSADAPVAPVTEAEKIRLVETAPEYGIELKL